jgi:glycerate kinase
VVIAPDKFKGTLTASEVAQALAAGIGNARLAPLAVKDDTVLIEAAAICGLGARRDPLTAGTYGMGEAILLSRRLLTEFGRELELPS